MDKIGANISDVVAAKIARSPARLDFAFAFPTTQSVGVNAEKFCRFGYGNKLTYNAYAHVDLHIVNAIC